MSLEYNPELISFAKELRKNATPQENHLWYDFLSKYEIRFQRQKVIGEFIADFYSRKARLVIEIDGSQHRTIEGKAYDEIRTAFLESQGLKVIRFSNMKVDNHFDIVCREIDIEVKSRIEELNQ